jgi:hypothetical protein
MRTPDGKECKFFYGDYYRGRNHEECRLLLDSPTYRGWASNMCTGCPVPGILSANACENMKLKGKIHRPFPFLNKQVAVEAYCVKCECDVQEPHIGCGECHTLPSIFTGAFDESNNPG